ncbi:hypothetical protein BDR07DRAFT_449924 [Suillus spraguei]|nr:hypothetical protein BDR07DRAFT_449924 [Suillus spraguei]
MALIAPELIVIWTMRQWISAHRVTRQFKESGYFKISQPQGQSGNNDSMAATAEQYVEDHNSTWLLNAHPKALTPRHGGTRALAKPFKKLLRAKAHVSEQSEDYTWTQMHSFFVLIGGSMLYVDKKPYHTLEPHEGPSLICVGHIDAPKLAAKQIQDRSKGNAISKGLIILQVVTRVIYHLETTQLEVRTLAFGVLNFLTYAVLWNKPLNVQCPHPVYWKLTESRPENHIKYVCLNNYTAADGCVYLSVHESNQVTGWETLTVAVFGPIFWLVCPSQNSETLSSNI